MIELKGHPYFNGIDWDEVGQKNSIAPYEVNIQIQENKSDLISLLKINAHEHDENLIERFRGKCKFCILLKNFNIFFFDKKKSIH